MKPVARLAAFAMTSALLLPWLGAHADETTIRKNIATRLPSFPPIDEVSKSPMAGVWELRIGMDVMYTDATGDHIMQGVMLDTQTRANLTEKRIEKLTAVNFSALPLKDALVVKQGNGSRKVAVFADPNCGYCKKFERDLLAVKDVTIYTFLYPILGEDSTAKSLDIWCSKDAMATWRAWMLDAKAPVRNMGKCDAGAIDRNVAFGQKYRINGTPAVLFEDGRRVPGALSTAEIERGLTDAAAAMAKAKPKAKS